MLQYALDSGAAFDGLQRDDLLLRDVDDELSSFNELGGDHVASPGTLDFDSHLGESSLPRVQPLVHVLDLPLLLLLLFAPLIHLII